jgi:hypothetical protein
MLEVEFKTKILLKDTLRELPVKGTIAIKNRMFKTATIRTAANKMKKEGFIFEVSDKGRIDDTIVTRLK